MANGKKRPSKNVKAARKLLSDSKMLANVRAANDVDSDQTFNADNSLPKQAAPIKVRPEKKRG